ncbi:MAG: hypothetical protein Q4D04_14075, partial [Clostridia bacterium]|nr:hypothetical protein [Clostridia bacterium]
TAGGAWGTAKPTLGRKPADYKPAGAQCAPLRVAGIAGFSVLRSDGIERKPLLVFDHARLFNQFSLQRRP